MCSNLWDHLTLRWTPSLGQQLALSVTATYVSGDMVMSPVVDMLKVPRPLGGASNDIRVAPERIKGTTAYTM